MQLSFEVYRHLSEVPEIWKDSVKPDSGLSQPQLLIFEKAGLTHLHFFYVITKFQNEAILLSYYQHLSVTPDHFNCRDKPFQHHSLNVALRTVKPTLLVVGNLFRHDTPFQQFIGSAIPESEQGAVFQQTFEYMLDFCKASGIFLKDVHASWAQHILKDASYKQMEEDVSMEFKVPAPWQGLQDYEKQLKHKYLQRYRKIRQQLNGIEIREIQADEMQHRSADIYALYCQVSDKQLVSMGKLNEKSFGLMKQVLQDRYKVFAWFLDGKMVAFSSAILHDGFYDMNYIGFDYAVNQSHSIYFNILFHCLEQAILSGSHTLVLGRTALEAKAILGCEPAYQYGFYKLRHPIVNWFFKKVSAGFREQIGEKWKDRHPFKSQFYTQQTSAPESHQAAGSMVAQ